MRLAFARNKTAVQRDNANKQEVNKNKNKANRSRRDAENLWLRLAPSEGSQHCERVPADNTVCMGAFTRFIISSTPVPHCVWLFTTMCSRRYFQYCLAAVGYLSPKKLIINADKVCYFRFVVFVTSSTRNFHKVHEPFRFEFTREQTYVFLNRIRTIL